jgi:hypothetical protein
MGRLSDLLIDMEADAEGIIQDCEDVGEFYYRMQKIDKRYDECSCRDFWFDWVTDGFFKNYASRK